MKINTCCFFGHKTIRETDELKSKLFAIIEKLILDENVNTFLFGSNSRFNSLCHETVTEIKKLKGCVEILRILFTVRYDFILH